LRTLVTGAAGFVGRHFLRAIAVDGPPDAHGADRIALDALEAPADSEELRQGLRSYRALDVTDAAAVVACVREVRPDAVVHLAAQASVAVSLERPAETFRVNAVGALNVLEAARVEAPDAAVLLVGSADVYGSGEPGVPISEEAPLRPRNPYALSKAAQDMLGELYSASYGLRVVRTRTFSHTGPGQRPTFALAGFADQLARIDARLRPAEVKTGNLEFTREYGDVRDVARAYIALLERGEPGEAYNVCTGEGYRLRDLLDRLIRISGVRATVSPDPVRMRARDGDHLVGDPSKLRRRTGWTPAIPIDRTLLDLYRDARERVRNETGR
jgi:GDP-4-dehydro-6-deoxy-D-mannose reductase